MVAFFKLSSFTNATICNSRTRKSKRLILRVRLLQIASLVNHFYLNFTSEARHSLLFFSPEVFRVCTMLSFALRVPLFLKRSCLRGKFVSFLSSSPLYFLFIQCIDTIHTVALPSLILLHCLRRFLSSCLCASLLLPRPPPRSLLSSCHLGNVAFTHKVGFIF